MEKDQLASIETFGERPSLPLTGDRRNQVPKNIASIKITTSPRPIHPLPKHASILPSPGNRRIFHPQPNLINLLKLEDTHRLPAHPHRHPRPARDFTIRKDLRTGGVLVHLRGQACNVDLVVRPVLGDFLETGNHLGSGGGGGMHAGGVDHLEEVGDVAGGGVEVGPVAVVDGGEGGGDEGFKFGGDGLVGCLNRCFSTFDLG